MRRTAWSASSALLALLLALVTLGLIGTVVASPAFASSWSIALRSGSSAQARSQPAPAAPGSVTATCTSSGSDTVSVSWSAVTVTTSYTVLESTRKAAGPYTVLASATGTSWTSGALSNGKYWFEVTATLGSNWTGPESAATAERKITAAGSHCS